MDSESKVVIAMVAALALTICFIVGVNVTTAHACKVKAIATGMQGLEVKDACK